MKKRITPIVMFCLAALACLICYQAGKHDGSMTVQITGDTSVKGIPDKEKRPVTLPNAKHRPSPMAQGEI